MTTTDTRNTSERGDINHARAYTREEAQLRDAEIGQDRSMNYEAHRDNTYMEYKFGEYGTAHGFLTEEGIQRLTKHLNDEIPGLHEKLIVKRAEGQVELTPEETDAVQSLMHLDVHRDVVRLQVLGDWDAAAEADFWQDLQDHHEWVMANTTGSPSPLGGEGEETASDRTGCHASGGDAVPYTETSPVTSYQRLERVAPPEGMSIAEGSQALAAGSFGRKLYREREDE